MHRSNRHFQEEMTFKLLCGGKSQYDKNEEGNRCVPKRKESQQGENYVSEHACSLEDRTFKRLI